MSLLELMISMFILAVGMVGVLAVILASMTNNSRNKSDTGATFTAQLVLEQIGAAGTATTLSMTDCAGGSHTLTLGASTASTGSGATLYTTATAPFTSQVNSIDWTQSASSVPSGYQMYWTTCDANGIKQTFDVRWNIVSLTALSGQSTMVTVGARPKAAQTTEIRRFATPATLRLLKTN